MNITIQEKDGNRVALLEGRFDTASTPEAEKALQPLYSSENQKIILDCTGLTYISSSGLRIFLSVLKTTKDKGCQVYLSGLNNDLRHIFTMTGFINLFRLLD
jgi:anti-sigma B factor antagonist